MNGKGGFTYIVTNYTRTVLYIGVTADLPARVQQHKDGNGSTFTAKYNCKYLVYWEFYERIEEAILREKKLKKYPRLWKENLIKEMNPKMKDLSDDISELM